jgi:glutamate--cysteine ligase catalytic subunit
MGLLSLGTPMTWDDAKKKSDFVHGHGITQFLNVWKNVSTTKKDSEGLLWGDEIEYSVVNMDKRSKVARLSLNAAEVLADLQEDELLKENYQASWKPEYAKYMIEGTPGLPYGSRLIDLLKVEDNMKLRRQLIREKLGANEVVVSLTAFPTLGAPDFLYPNYHHPNPDPKLISLSPEMFKNVDFKQYEEQLSLEEILDNMKPSCSQSLFIPDQAITDHARFPTLTANIRQRRGSKVAINLPIYKDHLTPQPFREPVPESIASFVNRFAKEDQSKNHSSNKSDDHTLYSPTISSGSDGSDTESIYCHSLNEPVNQEILKCNYQKSHYTLPEVIEPAKENHVYLDCMCFGMGCSCLQVTFQASDIQEARFIYDALAPITPLLLALSAGAPAYKGYLVDTDCRWNVISGSVDDRNPVERGLREALPGETKENGQPFLKINKSRYDSIDSYLSIGPDYAKTGHDISKNEYFKDKYNDIDLVYDKDIYNNLIHHDIDELLAKHIAHLFIRDPLVIFNELLIQDDENSTDHFENIQSTNWQTLRFKPPPPNSEIGWRIEFRSMEVQLTDFANAAFSIFLLLLTRTIKALHLNFYIPISKIDENMQVAQVRDAARTKKFWFRRHVLPLKEGEEEDDTCELMTIDQIINGFEDEKGTFPGLLSLVCEYLSKSKIEDDVLNKLNRYINFISKRASGELVTDAVWIRDFITHHKDYKHDSKVHSSIVYDLLTVLEGVNQRRPEDLLSIIDTVGVCGIFNEEEKVKYENEIKMKLEKPQVAPQQQPENVNLIKKRLFKSLNTCYSKKMKRHENTKEEEKTIASTSSSPELQNSTIETTDTRYVR